MNMSNKDRFIHLCKEKIRRDGIGDLLTWLEASDFYIAPASTRYHCAYSGGLLEHTLNVYEAMRKLCEVYGHYTDVDDESIAIIALFHDLCKVNFYKPNTQSVKVDGSWQTMTSYSIEEELVYGGHGSKSVFLVERFMRLTPEEAIAINCHMGAWNGDKDVGNVYDKHPVAFLVHMADEVASFLMEKREHKPLFRNKTQTKEGMG